MYALQSAFSSHDSAGVCRQRRSSQPAAHGPCVIKGCGENTEEEEAEEAEKLLKLYLAWRRSPVSRQHTSYEIRRF